MDQCCQHLVDCQEYATDATITPLVQLSTLICRVQDYFSYHDTENSDVNGEALLHLSAANFDRELARITSSIPQQTLLNNREFQHTGPTRAQKSNASSDTISWHSIGRLVDI